MLWTLLSLLKPGSNPRNFRKHIRIIQKTYAELKPTIWARASQTFHICILCPYQIKPYIFHVLIKILICPYIYVNHPTPNRIHNTSLQLSSSQHMRRACGCTPPNDMISLAWRTYIMPNERPRIWREPLLLCQRYPWHIINEISKFYSLHYTITEATRCGSVLRE